MPNKLSGLFGGTARTAILTSLAIDGDQTRRGVARRLQIEPTFALNCLRSLAETGIVDRKGDTLQFSFNWSFPVSNKIAAVLSALANRQFSAMGETSENYVFGPNCLNLFGTRTRTLVLLFVAYNKSMTLPELSAAIDASRDSLRTASESLVRAGHLEMSIDKHRRRFKLSPSQPAAEEIHVLLAALARVLPVCLSDANSEPSV